MTRTRRAPRRLALLAVSLTGSLALVPVGCRPSEGVRSSGAASGQGDDGARLRLEVDPRLGDASVSVYLLDGDAGGGVSGARVEIVGTMTHAGMSPVVREAAEIEPGLYRADDFAFTVAGDWVVTAEVVLPDGRDLVREVTTTVPAGP